MSKPLWEPRPEQQRGEALLVKEKGVRMFLPPGKGKTSTTLSAFLKLQRAGEVDCLLVLAPLRVLDTSWPQEIEKWANFEGMTYSIIHGGKGKGFETQQARQDAMTANVDVYLMNIEGLLSPEWRRGPKERGYPANPWALNWLKGKRVMLVVDESQRFKSWTSTTTETLKKYLQYFSRRVILTGSPKEDKLDDLFSQFYITDIGKDFGRYITHFRRDYLMKDYDGNIMPYPDSMDKICAKIAPTTIQLEDDEKMPLQEVDYWVPMSKEAKKTYNELRKEFLTTIEGKSVLAPNAGVLFNKLRQCAQGAVWLPDAVEREFVTLHEGKLDALENLLEELNGDPLFCLYQYQHDYMRMEKRLKRSLPRIGGNVSRLRGKQYCDEFSRGAHPLLMAHPDSAAYGIDGLQNECNRICWFGLDVSYRKVYQANKRIIRSGTKAEEVYIYRIFTDCAVERAVIQMVERKEAGAKEMVDILREYLKNE